MSRVTRCAQRGEKQTDQQSEPAQKTAGKIRNRKTCKAQRRLPSIYKLFQKLKKKKKDLKFPQFLPIK